MKELSKKLSLVLAEYSELPDNIQENIDFYKRKKEVYRMKGDLILFETDKKYLYVKPELFRTCL